MAFRKEILNTYDFIDEWRMEPCLWNDRVEGYRDKSARESALKRLAEKFNMNEFDAKAKITNLRTYYVRELSKEKQSSNEVDGQQIYVSKWPYFNDLEFLRDHVTHRRPKINNAESHSQATHANTGNEGELHEDANIDEDDETNTDLSHQNKRSSKDTNSELDRRRTKKAKTKESELLELASGLLRLQSAGGKLEEDADDAFGRHVAHELRNITDSRTKQLAKLQIQNILYEVQFGPAPLFSNQAEEEPT